MLALCRMLSLRESLVHPGRSALVVASIALGVIAWTTTSALSKALDDSLRKATVPAGAADFHVVNGDFGVPRELAQRVAGVRGVRSARPVVIEKIRVTGVETARAVLLGVDLLAYRDELEAHLPISASSAAAFVEGLALGENPVLVGASLASRVAPGGGTFTAMIAGNRRTLKCVGTFDPEGPLIALGGSAVLTGDREAAALAGHPGRVSRIDVTAEQNADLRAVFGRVAREIGDGFQVVTPEARDGRLRQSLEALRVGFALGGMGALGLALFLVANVTGVSVAERRRTIGLLRSLGSTSGQVRVEILGESMILAAVGSLVGVPLGFLVARLSVGPLLRAVGDVFIPLQSDGIGFDPSLASAGVLAGLLTSLLASWSPASRASAMSPTRAMKPGGGELSIAPGRRGLAAAGLLALAAAVHAGQRFAPGSFRVYLVLGLGLLASVLIVPVATGRVALWLRPIAGRVAGVPGRLAIDSLIRSPSRAGSAVAGLVGGVALMIQTGGVIHGNESAVRAWVDDCITGDLFLTSGGPMSASGRTIPMEESLTTRIVSTLPRSKVVPMTFRHLDWTCRGERTRVLMLALDAPEYLRMSADRSPPLRDRELYRSLLAYGTALVSENFAALNGVGVGSVIALPGAEGPVSLKVVGTVLDFSNSRGTILVDRRGVGKAFSTSTVDLFAIGLPRGLHPGTARLAIARSPWAAEGEVEAMTREGLRGHILGMIRRLHGIAYIQELVAATVAALGVAASMLICVVQRRRELGLLRALGATSRQVFVTVITEALAMAGIGVGLGIGLGLALEWYVLRVILLAETGFGFPVPVPWADALTVSAVVGIATALAGLAPALSASRMGIGAGLARE